MKKHIIILSAITLSLVLSAGSTAFASGKTSASTVCPALAPGGAENHDAGNRTVPEKDRNVSYLDAIRFENGELVKDAGSVSLNMDIVLDSTKIRTQHTVTLTPALVSKDGSREVRFEPVIIDGSVRHKVFLRQDRLDGTRPQRDSAQAIIKRQNGKEQEYTYVSEVPYGRWMLDGSIRIYETVSGCADCGEGMSDRTLIGHILPEFIPEWRTGTIAPEPEPIKIRAETRVARLQFRHDRYDILPSLANNRAVLDTVYNSIALVKEKEYIYITGIYVAGFASPEGTYEYNVRLSSNRARAFADYIARKNDFNHDLMHVEWSGEDWDGFRTELDKTFFPKKDSIISIIDTYTRDRNECERRMRSILTAAEYKWLVDEIYPYLRHCTYRVEYNVRNFNLEEAKELIYERPQDLNLKEIYEVAASYGKGTEGYEHAITVAQEYYPTAPALVNDLAIKAIAQGDYDKAIRKIRELGIAEEGELTEKEAELTNTLGVAYAKEGRYTEARSAFERASGAGNEEASHNLTQLLNVLDQM